RTESYTLASDLYGLTYSAHPFFVSLFFFNAPPTTPISTLSLHDALPISMAAAMRSRSCSPPRASTSSGVWFPTSARRSGRRSWRSEEHTSELQSRSDLVCRLLLEKKKNKTAGADRDKPEQRVAKL